MGIPFVGKVELKLAVRDLGRLIQDRVLDLRRRGPLAVVELDAVGDDADLRLDVGELGEVLAGLLASVVAPGDDREEPGQHREHDQPGHRVAEVEAHLVGALSRLLGSQALLAQALSLFLSTGHKEESG